MVLSTINNELSNAKISRRSRLFRTHHRRSAAASRSGSTSRRMIFSSKAKRRAITRDIYGIRLSHTVRLVPPAYVKPFVKRQKNDALGP